MNNKKQMMEAVKSLIYINWTAHIIGGSLGLHQLKRVIYKEYSVSFIFL
uniref:Uncharacterized protein n=1 Tax=Rhizophora mucronata TaxID=61149 RepID=A0A2P2PN85_RHIMU